MLSLAVRNTKKLVRRKVEEENVRIGRYFTKKEQAALMANMLTLPKKETVSVLDAGAGTGILAAAVVERLAKAGKAKEIFLDCYETNEEFLPMLKDNLERIRKKVLHDYKIRLRYTVKEENYILAQGKMTPDDPRVSMLDKVYYDLAISNPPRELMKTDSPEYAVCRRLCSGETDLSYMFAAAVSAALVPNGEAVLLLPVVYATGAYVEKIRRYMFDRAVLTGAHANFCYTLRHYNSGQIGTFSKSPITNRSYCAIKLYNTVATYTRIRHNICTENISCIWGYNLSITRFIPYLIILRREYNGLENRHRMNTVSLYGYSNVGRLHATITRNIGCHNRKTFLEGCRRYGKPKLRCRIFGRSKRHTFSTIQSNTIGCAISHCQYRLLAIGRLYNCFTRYLLARIATQRDTLNGRITIHRNLNPAAQILKFQILLIRIGSYCNHRIRVLSERILRVFLHSRKVKDKFTGIQHFCRSVVRIESTYSRYGISCT